MGLAIVMACVGLAVTAGAAAAGAPVAPRASLQNFVCQTALAPPTRGVSVTAVMRPVPGTEHMEVKFNLLRSRHRFGPFRLLRLRAGGLGKWVKPDDPTLGQLPADVWEPTGEVADLAAPAYYRMHVSFRWLGADDTRLAFQTRTSAVCFQPELRPYLVIRSVTITPLASPSTDDAYVAVVANRGATAAGPFGVQLSEGPVAVVTTQVPGLSAHVSRKVVFDASACSSGEEITVTADPSQVIDVASRLGSSLSVICQ